MSPDWENWSGLFRVLNRPTGAIPPWSVLKSMKSMETSIAISYILAVLEDQHHVAWSEEDANKRLQEAFISFGRKTYFTLNGGYDVVQERPCMGRKPRKDGITVLAELPLEAIFFGVYRPDGVSGIPLIPGTFAVKVEDAIRAGATWHWRDGSAGMEIAWAWPEHYFRKV